MVTPTIKLDEDTQITALNVYVGDEGEEILVKKIPLEEMIKNG